MKQLKQFRNQRDFDALNDQITAYNEAERLNRQATQLVKTNPPRNSQRRYSTIMEQIEARQQQRQRWDRATNVALWIGSFLLIILMLTSPVWLAAIIRDFN